MDYLMTEPLFREAIRQYAGIENEMGINHRITARRAARKWRKRVGQSWRKNKRAFSRQVAAWASPERLPRECALNRNTPLPTVRARCRKAVLSRSQPGHKIQRNGTHLVSRCCLCYAVALCRNSTAYLSRSLFTTTDSCVVCAATPTSHRDERYFDARKQHAEIASRRGRPDGLTSFYFCSGAKRNRIRCPT